MILKLRPGKRNAENASINNDQSNTKANKLIGNTNIAPVYPNPIQQPMTMAMINQPTSMPGTTTNSIIADLLIILYCVN
jgi:hypothetical protein